MSNSNQIDFGPNVQNLLNGKYDRYYMLGKAKREYIRLRESINPISFTDNLIDFSNSINQLADWYWGDLLAPKTSTDDVVENDAFRRSISNASAECRAFVEISNTLKHHTRNHPNQLGAKIWLIPGIDANLASTWDQELCFKWLRGNAREEILILPVIKTSAQEHFYLLKIAETAVTFWAKLIGDEPSNSVS